MGFTSEHFKELELACPCCGVNGVTQAALDAAEQFRAKAGAPVVVMSGYRCAERNAEVGGAPASQHLLGQALDLRIPRLMAAELELIALGCDKIHAYGRSDHAGYIHIDVRPIVGGKIVKWCYKPKKVNGKWIEVQVPYYPPKTGSTAP